MPGHEVAESIKQAYKADPFQPFTVTLRDGQTYDIDHPDRIWVGLQSHICVIQTGEDSYQFVDTSYLKSVELKAA